MDTNKDNIFNLLNADQREFVEYLLRNHVAVGVDELDVGKLSPVLIAKYGSIHAAPQGLGTPQQIQQPFLDFQKYLYTDDLVA